jgi:Bacterial regulatory proteins, luxR family
VWLLRSPVRQSSGRGARRYEPQNLEFPLTEGATSREATGRLVISRQTVEHDLENVYNKLGLTSKTAAAVFEVRNRLI